MTLNDSTASTRATRSRSPVGSARSWARFLACFTVLYGVLAATSAVDATGRWGLAILAAVLVTALAVEKVLYRASLTVALGRLGLGRPGGRSLAVAAVVSVVVLLVYPVSAVVSGSPMQVLPDWLWLLVGLFVFHGVAEELVWRGFAFRRLREGPLLLDGGVVDDAADSPRPTSLSCWTSARRSASARCSSRRSRRSRSVTCTRQDGARSGHLGMLALFVAAYRWDRHLRQADRGPSTPAEGLQRRPEPARRDPTRNRATRKCEHNDAQRE